MGEGLGYTGAIDKDEVGDWLSERENLWKGLEDREYGSIKLDDNEFDPFNSELINAVLNPYGLVYSGGIGRFGRPHFFSVNWNAGSIIPDTLLWFPDASLRATLQLPGDDP